MTTEATTDTVAVYDGTEYVVDPSGLADMIAFERAFGVPASVFDEDDPTPIKMEWIAFLVWRCLKRMDVTKEPFFTPDREPNDGFLELLSEVRMPPPPEDEDEADAAPLGSEQPTA